MTDWILHESTEPPELPPAALVEVVARNGHKNYKGESVAIDQVGRVSWGYVREYRVLRNPGGHPYVSAEGLDRLAKWVTTDEDGTVIQWGSVGGLWVFHPGVWRADQDLKPFWMKAPLSHRHPGDWRDSLCEVWREDYE